MNEQMEATPDPKTDSPLDSMGAADISELLKSSQAPQPQPDDFIDSDALDELYRQAVEAATEWEWPIPSRVEFEKQYQQETAKLRRHDAM